MGLRKPIGGSSFEDGSTTPKRVESYLEFSKEGWYRGGEKLL